MSRTLLRIKRCVYHLTGKTVADPLLYGGRDARVMEGFSEWVAGSRQVVGRCHASQAPQTHLLSLTKYCEMSGLLAKVHY